MLAAVLLAAPTGKPRLFHTPRLLRKTRCFIGIGIGKPKKLNYLLIVYDQHSVMAVRGVFLLPSVNLQAQPLNLTL